ncbi:MAG TPA: GNAT family N-acetyltransferase [Devosia sp.]|jgi:GNAT superfamily N-acetyltransferase|nr:GNAT family N-acetyltransferase [Devosia sp.]
MEISDLREREDLLPTAANRIWKAWWESGGTRYSELEARLRDVVLAGGTTFSLVAHDGDGFVGTASVIPSDMDERPHYSPWVAAVWIEEHRRGEGHGGRLVSATISEAYERGARELYLCARPAMQPFYERLGWTIIEQGVGRDRLSVFRARPDGSATGTQAERA